MNYLDEINNEIEVPAIKMKSIRTSCECFPTEENIKWQWNYMQKMKNRIKQSEKMRCEYDNNRKVSV